MAKHKRKEPYKRKSFETRIPGLASETKEPYAGIAYTLFMSDAWRSLSAGAINLYLAMRYEYKGGDELTFNFNRGKWLNNPKFGKNNYKLFKSPNDFYKSRDELVRLGFIEVVESGRNTRTKAVYTFSDKWQRIKGITCKHNIIKARQALDKC